MASIAYCESPSRRHLTVALVVLILTWPGVDRAEAQPAPPPAVCQTPQALPRLTPRPPLPPTEVRSFVDRLSNNDAMFEVLVGQARILTIKADIKRPNLVAVGDPTIVNFTVLNERQIRLLGIALGVTDLSLVTSDGRTVSFEVQVVPDLDILRARLRSAFPDARLKLSHMRDHLVVEGEARSDEQVIKILEMIHAYMRSVLATERRKVAYALPSGLPPTTPGQPNAPGPAPAAPGPGPAPAVPAAPGAPTGPPPGATAQELTTPATITYAVAEPEIINLIRVPGSQQILLKVRVAELNRTGMRQIGADFLAIDHDTGAIIGTQIGGAGVNAVANAAGNILSSPVGLLTGSGSNAATSSTTAFGIFPKGGFDVMFSALRRNNLLKILAEPNLVAMNGHHAFFLAGGKFPVPVAQPGSSGAAPSVSVQFQDFGVQLDFTPYIEDHNVIRLTVHPQVSSVDFTLGTVLVPGGTPVPGLNSREAETTVELHEGETLAIAGLLQLTLDGQTSRIPGLGDLPILGPFFSNTTNDRIEKELVVLVTPYLAGPLDPQEMAPLPGAEVNEPNDLEFYLFNRIEGRTGVDYRSTTHYDDPLHLLRCFMKLENEYIQGPCGYCE